MSFWVISLHEPLIFSGLVFGDQVIAPNATPTFPHCSIHTVDLVSIQALRKMLRDHEKTLEAYWTKKDEQRVLSLLQHHPLAKKNQIEKRRFVVIAPVKTWKSRTLPLHFYQELIACIQEYGYGVLLVGKEVFYQSAIDIQKTLYEESAFPGTLCLYNKLTFAQLCYLYSMTPIAINTENGHHPISCTNDFCWNLYIPSLSAPEMRLPHRHGSQYYKTYVVNNTNNYYPASVYGDIGTLSYIDMPVQWPTVGQVFHGFIAVAEAVNTQKKTAISQIGQPLIHTKGNK